MQAEAATPNIAASQSNRQGATGHTCSIASAAYEEEPPDVVELLQGRAEHGETCPGRVGLRPGNQSKGQCAGINYRMAAKGKTHRAMRGAGSSGLLRT